MSTYSNQSQLPRLPIPKLEETLQRFPGRLAALQNSEQRKETKRIAEEFLNGEGPKLHELLVQYDDEGRKAGTIGSFVEEFWNDSYLAPPCSVVLNLNPFFLLEDGPDPDHDKSQIGRASSLLFASLKYASMLKTETLAPDEFRGSKLCMDQFKSLFGSCRIPCEDKDVVENDPFSSHVVVMKRNWMYYFQGLWPDGTVAVTQHDIRDILKAVEKDVQDFDEEKSAEHAIGVLTTMERRVWAKARRELSASSSHNHAALRIIDSALFVLVLDDFVPKNVDEAASNMLHGTYQLRENEKMKQYQVGTCCNRWYDKLQLIVCSDGTAGINFEHSSIDGHTALRFVSDVFAETVVCFAQSITKTIYGGDRVPSVLKAPVRRAAGVLGDDGKPLLDTRPKRIDVELPASTIDKIYYAETNHGDDLVSTETRALEFKKFGKNFITSHNMSPDSFVQMAILLAYYRLYGKVVCQYEPVLTKRFLHGRTEAMRSATPKAAAFCEAWCSRFTSSEQKIAALAAATSEHSSIVRECATGKGVERHLFALKCIAEKSGLPVPSFFKSEAWSTLNHTILSTSNCGNPSLRHFGFGPVVPDGFGIGYIIKDNALHFSIASRCRQTDRYRHTLRLFLHEVKAVLAPKMRIEVSSDLTKSKKVGVKAIQPDQVFYADGFDEYQDISRSPSVAPKRNVPNDEERRQSFMIANVKVRPSLAKEELESVGVAVSDEHLQRTYSNTAEDESEGSVRT